MNGSSNYVKHPFTGGVTSATFVLIPAENPDLTGKASI